jgi:di/tricarboxylate transporter
MLCRLDESEIANKEYIDSSVSILDSKISCSTVKNNLGESFSKMMCLSVAVACNIGGTATLTGSGTNLVLYGAADE